MQWFAGWWETLLVNQKVFACIAILATAILVLKTILLLFGIGIDSYAESCSGSDDGRKHSRKHYKKSGLRLFTVRGFVSFFAIGGWLAVAFLGDDRLTLPAALILAFAGGFVALLLDAVMVKWAFTLQEK